MNARLPVTSAMLRCPGLFARVSRTPVSLAGAERYHVRSMYCSILPGPSSSACERRVHAAKGLVFRAGAKNRRLSVPDPCMHFLGSCRSGRRHGCYAPPRIRSTSATRSRLRNGLVRNPAASSSELLARHSASLYAVTTRTGNARRGRVALELAHERELVYVRPGEVHDHQVDRTGPDPYLGGRRVRCRQHLVTCQAQQRLEDAPQVRIVSITNTVRPALSTPRAAAPAGGHVSVCAIVPMTAFCRVIV